MIGVNGVDLHVVSGNRQPSKSGRDAVEVVVIDDIQVPTAN
jgi:hypothetical protein